MTTIQVQFHELSFIKNNWERIMIKQMIEAVNKAKLVDWMKEYNDGFFHLHVRDHLISILRQLNDKNYNARDLEVALYCVQYIARYGIEKFKEARLKNY